MAQVLAIGAREGQPCAVAQQDFVFVEEHPLQPLDLPNVHQCRMADAQEKARRQLRGHHREGIAEPVRLLADVQFHAIVDGLHPLNVGKAQREHEAVGVHGNLFLQARFRAEAFQQVLGLLWRKALDRGGAAAGS